MNNVDYIIGSEKISNRGLPIFNDTVIDFLDDLSRSIFQNPACKPFPDLISFAFWIRKANVHKLKGQYASSENRLGRGLCFHVTPSNIPMNFAFSYVFSLLAGNSNVVRLPSKSFPQVELLLEILSAVIRKHPTVSERTAFVRYSRTSEATQSFSKLADARMIWGGDETIQQIRHLDTKPRAVDITFADRYSITLIDAKALLNLNSDGLQKLASDFYNDTYLMDQNACSSPQLIYWVNAHEDAKKRFWAAVFQVASQKYSVQDALMVEKFTKLCEDSIQLENIEEIKRQDNLVFRVALSHVNQGFEKNRGKGGYFYEYDLKSLDEIGSIVTDKYQTISYFGVDPASVQSFVISQNLPGIDRIVPIGKAMDIELIWDGHDLILELSRAITIR